MNKIRFIIVGSGWRSLYYVRVAKALLDIFELCAMYSRTEGKAQNPLKDALQDAYMAILLWEADASQKKISSSKQAWHEA